MRINQDKDKSLGLANMWLRKDEKMKDGDG